MVYDSHEGQSWGIVLVRARGRGSGTATATLSVSAPTTRTVDAGRLEFQPDGTARRGS